MGLCIEADENLQNIAVEIRKESIMILSGDTVEDRLIAYDGGTVVELNKSFLKRIISFFNENPKYLEVK